MDRNRWERGAFWLTVFGAILASWAALYAMAIPADLREASRIFGAQFWSDLCRVTPDMAGYGRLVLMWALMSTAMMLPTALPAFRAYDDLGGSGAETKPYLFAIGFLSIWLGFALIAAGLQLALFQAGVVSDFGDSRSVVLSAVLLALAGGYQLSSFKRSCASQCRAPVAFFMHHWDVGAFGMGLRLGALCVGCCWALMLLAFVGGVTSLAFMGLATLIMVIEKLPEIGGWISRPLGAVLLAAAAWVALTGI